MSAVVDIDRESEEYGWTCHPCRKQRAGCSSPQHAANSANVHNRERHAEPTLNLSALARLVHEVVEGDGTTEDESVVAWEAWKAVTGLTQEAALDFITAVLQSEGDVILHVAPF